MMRLHCLFILAFIFTAFFSYGQWNVQTGYDFGTFTIPKTQRKNFNNLHRFSLIGEYIFSNEISVNINTGIDLHKIDYQAVNTIEPTSNYSKEFITHNNINIQNFKFGLSMGYNFILNNNSSIKVSLNYDHYFVNRLTIKESYSIINSYSVPTDEIESNEPLSKVHEFSPELDYERFGYKNTFVLSNNNVSLSIGYRYRLGSVFINSSIRFSPLNTGFVLFRRQNLFLIGVNLGYTFPQKDGTDEK
ncbi:MAG: hypothetical protein ACQERC_01725 [Bacteroidota bacterium]